MAISVDQLDFSEGKTTKVISGAQKFIIPVTNLVDGGEPLLYPKGHEKAGQQIVDWEGKPIGEKGIVFFNEKDNAVQAASGVNGVIIINQVTDAQAEKIHNLLVAGDAYPFREGGVRASDLSAVLAQIRKPVKEDGLGLVDMYNSDTDFIGKKMTPVNDTDRPMMYSLFKRDDRDVWDAVRLTGRGEFQGPAATPQKFEDGAIIVKNGKDVQLIQPAEFEQTYKHASGARIYSDQVQPQYPQERAPNAKAVDGGTVEVQSGQARGAATGKAS